MNNFNDKVSFIWSVADLLRGPYKPAQYGDVMLPLVVLCWLGCMLAVYQQIRGGAQI
jgi:type I restriction enzyme M protein